MTVRMMKKCLFEQWKARHQAYLAHKDEVEIQAVDEGKQNRRAQKLKE